MKHSTYAEVRFFKWQRAETSVSLRAKSASYGGGSEVLVIQEVTGTLSPGSHAGSYNGQDTYNDMLITDELRITEDRRIQEERPGEFLEAERLQGFNGSDSTGGGHEKSKKIDTRRV